MQPLAIALAALTLTFAPTNIKLEFIKGQSVRMRTVELSTTSQLDPTGKAVVIAKRTTTSNSVRKVLAIDKTGATIENRTIDGETKSQTLTGNSAYIVKPSVFRYHLSDKSVSTKLSRPAIPGVQDGRLTFLDGFSTPLPNGPVNPGATWSGSIPSTGVDGKPLKVSFQSTFIGPASKNGLPCWQIDTKFNADFKATGAQGAAKGSFKGVSTTYLATRLGIEVEAKTVMTLEIATLPTDPKVKPVTSRTDWNITTTSQK
jgi:hypothetical protein